MRDFSTHEPLPVPTLNGVIKYSGAEDVGFRRHDYSVSKLREALGRMESIRNDRAEDAARNRRLDHDRIVATALYLLRMHCKDDAQTIATNCGLQTDADPMELIDEIRAQLSPLVTGKVKG